MTTDSPALRTDLYQLTMAQGYWKLGLADRPACFCLAFRSLPFKGGYAIAAGTGPAIEGLEAMRFTADDRDYLASLDGDDGGPLFDGGFLAYLEDFRFAADVDAVPEGTAVFGHEPLVRVTGPMLHGQLAETPLLNAVNFQTLIATKAARVKAAAGDDPVLEFGLRRAQGPDGGLTASRAAYLGGADATSHVLAGKVYGIPVKGTHAHSWVMGFDDEREAFDAYADAAPNNVTLLVDTYDTLEGVRRAAAVGQRLQKQGRKLSGVRLDSGDLAYLSIEARKILDAAGLPGVKVVASNDLDEHLIASLKQQGARIDVWGVGTNLVTAKDQPALGGVYKLTAIGGADGAWSPRLKLSATAAKTSIPGVLNARRFYGPDGLAVADAIYDESAGLDAARPIVDPADPTRRRRLPTAGRSDDLLRPVLRNGNRVADAGTLSDARARVREQLAAFHPSIKRLTNPHEYPVGLTAPLHDLRQRLTLEMKGMT